MSILKVLAAAISCAMAVAVLHYFFIAVTKPRRLLELSGVIDDQQRNWPYLIAVFLGCGLVLFNGFDALLSWMPLSWGGADEDGTFRPVRHSIAGVIALLSLPLIDYIEKSATREVQLESLQERVVDLERQLTHALSNTGAS